MRHPISQRNLEILNGICQQNKIANGYIFHGPKGALISSAALHFALKLNCTAENSPCYNCTPCQTRLTGNNPDLIHIKPEKRLTIDLIRDLQEAVKYGPSQSKRLIAIIHNAQAFTKEAANAFLKTLEEPPENVSFILLTQNPAELIDTIRSRCQALDFPKLNHDLIESYIASLPEESKEHLTGLQHQLTTKPEYIKNSLLSSQVENPEPLEIELLTFQDIQTTSLTTLFSHIESYAKHPQQTTLLLYAWIHEITHKTDKTENDFKHLEKLIEIIRNMKYNVNHRLQLENLVLSVR